MSTVKRQSTQYVEGCRRNRKYEMPEEAIGHPGGWRTQVIFTKDNEDYTTRGLSSLVRRTLIRQQETSGIVDIENWNSFIAHAGELARLTTGNS